VSGGEPTNVNASNGFLLAAPGRGLAVHERYPVG
jgi:hypothetical protein